ncbi:MAG: hypothetical protein HQK57_04685 [Deltaproteobacteria bacterium]|nr:hypothetical protein [Deltaproteobacteria bacterium]
MEDTLDVQFISEEEAVEEADYQELAEGLRELDELEKMRRFLSAENTRLRRQVDILAGELEGLSIALSSTHSYISAYLERRQKSLDNLGQQKDRREKLILEIDQLHLKVKAAEEDERSLVNLSDSLQEELDEIKEERMLVRQKFDDIKSGIDHMAKNKEMKIPSLKSCDEVLRQIYRVFRETQHRMDVSLIMNKR